MTLLDTTNSPQTAGDIKIKEIIIIDRNGVETDIQSMMIELNIFEDIFSNTMYGNIQISDGLNLIEKLPIIGEEYIRINVNTPGFDSTDIIQKTFRVYSIANRSIVKDDRMQQYVLNFVSSEAFLDTLKPISKTFYGRADKVIETIFKDYLLMPRNVFGNDNNTNSKYSNEYSDVIFLDETKNNIAFNSPRWTPFKCINWICSRSIPKTSDGCNLLFFETNKYFVFGSVEKLIDNQIKNGAIAEHYIHSPSNIRGGNQRDKNFNYKKQNIAKEYRIVESFTIENNFDVLQNLQNGYYASKLYKFDVINKDYQWFDFDYVQEYNSYNHLETTSGNTGGPFFTNQTARTPDSKIMFYPSHPELYTDVSSNANDIIEKTLQNRISLLNDLNNYKLHVVVPGRTDIEVGNVVRFDFPAVGPKDELTTTDQSVDKYLGGFYLITAIRHKITYNKHNMLMELIKDSTKTSFES